MLFDLFYLRTLPLKNRVVMSPMTRSRAVDANTPNALMAEYYAQRAEAGLIITEGTSPSPNGLGYPRIPALFNEEHVRGWRLVTDSVHAAGGKIFVQLMHTGRVAHVLNLPAGAEVLSSSSIVCPGEIYTDASGLLSHTPPRAMAVQDIARAVEEHGRSAELAILAGFDGVELHGANGYLIEQFLNANINQRMDCYGGSIDNRNRFALEIVDAVVQAVGRDRVGIRLTPYGALNGTGEFAEMGEQFLSLAEKLSSRGVLYLHLADHSSMGTPPIPSGYIAKLRECFGEVIILAGGFDALSAETTLHENRADLIAFGRPFIANPDLVPRMQQGSPLNALDMNSFYTPGPQGYTDYPRLPA